MPDSHPDRGGTEQVVAEEWKITVSSASGDHYFTWPIEEGDEPLAIIGEVIVRTLEQAGPLGALRAMVFRAPLSVSIDTGPTDA